MQTDRALAPISKAAKMLAEAKTLDEILRVEDVAKQVKLFIQTAKLGREAERQASIIMLGARRKAGDTIREMQERGELATQSNGRPKVYHDATLTLDALGLTRCQSFRYQQEASVPEDEYQEWLHGFDDTDGDVTASGLRKLAKQRKAKTPIEQPPAIEGVCSSLQELIDDGKRFGCIYADPPWAYANQVTRASTNNHYSTMSVKDICGEPVETISAKNAHLHLWTTNAFIREAFDVINAWGFEYKSCLVWVKPQMGIGNYWRVSHEFLLLGVRGDCPFREHKHMSWIEANRSEHSVKPDVVRRLVEAVSTGPYLEMYGRIASEGWTVYGNQITERSPQRRLSFG